MVEWIVLTTLDRLRPFDTDEGKAFGLTLGVALGDEFKCDPLRHGRFLCPWSWPDVPMVCRVLPFSDSVDLEPIDVQLSGPGAARRMVTNAFDTWRNDLTAMFAQEPWSFQWQVRNTVSVQNRPWPALIAELATLPWPLAQALNLSYFFRVPLREEVNQIAAVPVLPPSVLEAGGVSSILQARCRREPPDVRCSTIDLLDDTGWPVAAVKTRRIEISPPTSPYLDFETLWTKVSDEAITGDDWRSGLEERLAAGLDLSAEYLEQLEKEGVENRKAGGDPVAVGRVLDRGFALLADLAGPGIRPRASGGRMIDPWVPDMERNEHVLESLASKVGYWFYGSREAARWSLALHQGGPALEPWKRAVRAALADESGGSEADALLLLDPHAVPTAAAAASRLRGLAASLSKPEALKRVFRTLWSNAATEASLGNRERAVALALAANGPRAEQIRELLRLDHLELVWGDLLMDLGIAGARDPSRLRDVLEPRVRTFVGARLGEGGADRVTLGIVSRAAPRKEDLDGDREQGASFRNKRGITVQVDTFGLPPESVGQGEEDLLERLQGVGVVMRRGGPSGEWRCLHLASPRRPRRLAECIADPQECVEDPQELEPLTVDPVVLPSRLTYQNGGRCVTLTYDNQPMTVEGPLAWASGTSLKPAAGGSFRAPIRFTYATPERARLPALTYGESYGVRPFLVSNCGALPKELVAPGGLPWVMREGGYVPPGNGPGDDFAYLRRTPVGALRIERVGGRPEVDGRYRVDRRPLDLPTDLQGAVPRLGELPSKAGGDEAVERRAPILLLVPNGLELRRGVRKISSFELGIRCPATDLHTWDRWLAAADGASEDRRPIWHLIYEDSLSHSQPDLSRDPQDLTLDDPAVDGIYLEVESLEGGRWVSVRATDTGSPLLFFPSVGNGGALRRHQRGQIVVRCKVDHTPTWSWTSSSFEITVAPGGLYRITAYAAVKRSELARFAPGARQASGDGHHVITSPHELQIEVATQLFDSNDPEDEREKVRAALWTSLQLDREAARRGELAVTLPLAPLGAKAGLFHRAELTHQAWTWRGRAPSSQHPGLGSGTFSGGDAKEELEHYLDWELRHMGDRADYEATTFPMERVLAQERESPSFRYVQSMETQGAGEFGAGHHRVAVDVYSRYESLFPSDQGCVRCQDSRGNKTEARWRRVFVPARFRGSVPTPAVRVVLPLTDFRPVHEADGKGGGAGAAPGVLVVVEGPWYDPRVGGLAEELEAEVLRIASPNRPLSNGKPPETGDCSPTDLDHCYWQLGPDPVSTGESAAERLGVQSLPPGFEALDAHEIDVDFDPPLGAAGHHRDRTDRTPRILASSFVLRPPRIRLKQGRQELAYSDADPAWWLFQVRFRKRILRDGAVLARSEPTAPWWIQFLPSFSRVQLDRFGVEEAVLRADPGGLDVWLENRAGIEIHPQLPQGTHVALVLSRSVSDITGGANQETYLGVWLYDHQARQWRTDERTTEELSGRPFAHPETLRARVLEIQRHERADQEGLIGERLWGALFDTKHFSKDLDRGRIVRISRSLRVLGERP